MSNRGSLRTVLRPLPGFVAYVMRHFWMARVALALTVLLLLIEYVVFSLMIPLAADGASTGGKGSVVRFWAGVAESLGLPAIPATWLWMFLVMLALRIALGFVHITLTTWVAKQVHRHLSEKTFGRVLLQEPMTEIYRRSIGYYITLAGDDTFRAGTLINTFSQVLASLTSVLAGFGLLLLFSPTLLWWTLAFLVVCAMAIALAFRTLLRTSVRSVDLSREAGTAYIEALNGLRSIRSMASERFFLANYSSQIGRYVRTLFEIDAVKSGMKFLPALLALLAGILVLWPGTDRSATLTASFFFAATTLLMRVFLALGALVNSSSTLLMDLRAANDIDELIGKDDGPAAEAEAEATPSNRVQVSTIELKSINYGYIPGRKVLDNLNFVFRAGQTVAIVGRSGSGKSTLADLLLGLIHPDAGRIEVNGGHESIQALRRHVILVEQQARIFSTSVRENLLLGLRRDDDALWHALRQVDLEAYVRTMPHGLDSLLDYQGANLSGGQRQRLGIARALVRDPQVLILDEATSALDMTTRVDLVRNLRQSMRTSILVFITHDESLAAESDVVLALDAAPVDAIPVGPLRAAVHLA